MIKKKEGFVGQRAIVIPYEIRQKIENNDLTKLLHVTDVGFYPCAQKHYRRRDKGIEQHILIYCYEGEGWYNIGAGRTTVKANNFFIIEAGIPHIYGASEKEPWSIYWMHFAGEKSTLFKSVFNKTMAIEYSLTARYQDRVLMFEEIIQNLYMGYSIENLEYVTLCLWHLLGSFYYIPQFREVNKPKPVDVIQKVIAFMKTNTSHRLTLEEIAQSVKYSPSYLSNIFTQRTGMTPIDYFNHLKIQRACVLLDFSEMKIKEIAFELGFSDQYYFSKVFAKYMAMSPLAYKKKQKG